MPYYKIDKSFNTDFAGFAKKPVNFVEIDKSNAISRDLYHSFLIDSFSVSDLVGNAGKGQITVTGSAVSLDNDNIGKVLLWDGTSSNQIDISNGTFHNDVDGSYTVAHTFKFKGNTSTSTPFMLSTSVPSLGNNNLASAVVSIEDDNVHTFLVTRDKSNIIAYLDGKEIASTTSIANRAAGHFFRYQSNVNTLYGYFGDGASNQLMIAGTPHTSSQRWDGPIYMSSFWRRALTPAESISYTNNPYQILKPASPNVYFLKSATSGAFTLVANSGTYTLNGTDAALAAGKILVFDSGAYSYTGANVDFPIGYNLQADGGTYSHSGTNVDLFRCYNLQSDSGTYTYTGTSADLVFASVGNFTLVADTAAYSYSGTPNALLFGAHLDSQSGTFSYTGAANTLTHGYTLTSDSGVYTYTGAAIAFSRDYVIGALSGNYVYNGTNAALTFTGLAPDIPAAGGIAVAGVLGDGIAVSATYGNGQIITAQLGNGATVKGNL